MIPTSAKRIRWVLTASFGLLALGSMPATATTLTEMEFTCPIGGQKFKATVVSSTFHLGIRLDLKSATLMPDLMLPVCPENGFVMYESKFSDDELGKLTPIVLSGEYQGLRAQNTSYFMVAYMQERIGVGDDEIAYRYLQASWEAEARGPQLTERYRRLALEKLEAALARGRKWELVLIAAELERLLGRFDAAEARLAGVPGGDLDAVQLKVLAQIRKHAQARNGEPQVFAQE